MGDINGYQYALTIERNNQRYQAFARYRFYLFRHGERTLDAHWKAIEKVEGLKDDQLAGFIATLPKFEMELEEALRFYRSFNSGQIRDDNTA